MEDIKSQGNQYDQMNEHPVQQPNPRPSAPNSIGAVLGDLTARFLLNLPSSELERFERIFYQLQQAHWYYEDFYREEDSSLPSFKLRGFCYNCFQVCPILRPHLNQFDSLFEKFQEYLYSVPVCGAILLNSSMDKCLLVKGWNAKSWGFPKGKINQGELEVDCAVREVLEETGVDVSKFVDANAFLRGHGKEMKLFVVVGVDEELEMKPRTRKEISDIRWFSFDEIVSSKSSPTKKKFRFWEVDRFMPKLKSWIKKRQKKMRNESNESGGMSSDAAQSSELQISSSNSSRSKKESTKKQTSSHLPLQETGITDQASTSTKVAKSRKKDDEDFQLQLTFGNESQRWSVEEMYSANQNLYGIKPTDLSNPDDLSSSLARVGSRYKPFQRTDQDDDKGGRSSGDDGGTVVICESNSKSWSFPDLVALNLSQSSVFASSSPFHSEHASFYGSSESEACSLESLSDFKFDVKGVMNALVSHMKV